MNTKIARLGSLLVFCLTLAIALVPPLVQAQDDIVEICDGSDKIQFHDKHSGFKLEAHCQGKIPWTVTLVGDVILDEVDIFLTFTIATEGNTIFDSTIVLSSVDNLVQRELLLQTKDGDKIKVTFKLR